IAGDWKASTSFRVTSGQALTVTGGLDQALNGINGQRPNLNGSPYAANQSPSQWLNNAAGVFTQPPFGTFGNLGAGAIRGPGLITSATGLSGDPRIMQFALKYIF